MADVIMILSGVMFTVLFVFLMFTFLIVFIAFIKKHKIYSEFEPYLSIIIPVYDEEKHIEECISSIQNQNYPKEKIEIIVVDDGSKDKTAEITKQYNVKLLFQLHKGKSEALNLGTKNAVHNFVVTIDADTVLDKDCLKKLVAPLADASVGATSGNSHVKNRKSILGWFQHIEYSYNNLIRANFSKIFKDGIWFFGALACYRKDVLKKVNYFKTQTLTEDMDIALDIVNVGYRVVNVQDSICYTVVPSTIKSLYNQRSRWWIGTLQALIKNKHLFLKNSTSLRFLFVNQFWWSVYSFISLPIILYQVNYWLPYNSQTIVQLAEYLIRWFSLLGPIYVLYKIPEWGISFYNIFGVLSGFISTFMIITAFVTFKHKFRSSSIFALIFYFPYTIFLNIFIAISILTHPFSKKRFFIR